MPRMDVEQELESGRRVAHWVVFWIAVVIAATPLLVDGVRAIDNGWIPHRDTAFVELRVHDVFTRHTPLVGMPAGGLKNDPDAFHLGPLEFWLLAVPYRIAGATTAGVVVGVLAWNVGCVVAIGLLARRVGGLVFAVGALLVTTGLVWAVGAGLAHNGFNPAFAILPTVVMLLLVVAIAYGDAVLLPALAFVVSVVAQTHLSFLAITVVAALLGCVAGGAVLRRRHRAGASWGPIVVATVAVVLVCWSGPLLQPLNGARWNLRAMLEAVSGSSQRQAGTSFAVSLTSRVAGFPPPFGVHGHPFQDTYLLPHGVRASTLLHLAVPFIAAAALFVVALRRRRASLAFALVTAGAALLTAFVTMSKVPLPGGFFSALAPDQYLWLMWPVAAAFWILVLLAVVQLFLARWAASRVLAGLLTVALVPVAVVASASRETEWPDPQRAIKVAQIEQIRARVDDELPAHRRYRIVFATSPDVATGMGAGLVAQLENDGYDVLVDTSNHTVAKLYTPHRRYRAQSVTGTISVMPAGARVPASARVLVTTDEGSPRRLAALEQQMARAIDDAGGLRLSAKGDAWWQAKERADPSLDRARYLSAASLLAQQGLWPLYKFGYVVGPPVSSATWSRLHELHAEVENRFVVVYQPSASGERASVTG